MYKVYTSYFARVKEIQKDGLLPVGIAVNPPSWYTGAKLPYLAPRIEMLNIKNTEKYKVEFNKILSNKNPQKVKVDIETLQNYFKTDVVLLCFEKDWNTCHRKMVAEWLNQKLAWNVTEWNVKEEKPKRIIPEQRNLFEI
jgi:hypothetical protein